MTVWWIFAILGKGIIDLTLYNDAFKLFTPNRNTGKFIRRAKDKSFYTSSNFIIVERLFAFNVTDS